MNNIDPNNPSTQSIRALKNRIKTLSHFIKGIRHAIETLNLTEEEKIILTKIMKAYHFEYEKAKEISKETKRKGIQEEREERTKPKLVDQVQLSYQKKRSRNIRETHKLSGFNRKNISILQGGAPGLGKKS